MLTTYIISEERHRQDSNLRGETPTDFESVALTTRPRCLFVSFISEIVDLRFNYNSKNGRVSLGVAHTFEKGMWKTYVSKDCEKRSVRC
mmetsp:Transcript_58374/g.66178  ORF Transcript_58374/g.66178 Transcript_58374/m.66178 type:complete len:89 (+) Transcript_58374:71-337(+)